MKIILNRSHSEPEKLYLIQQGSPFFKKCLWNLWILEGNKVKETLSERI